VREQAAGLIRSGVPPTTVRGVLSDPVDWYAYDAVMAAGAGSASCTAEDIALVQIDELQLSDDGEVSAERPGAFILKHLAREQSRPLRADFLASGHLHQDPTFG
jgi:hypothetical protein